MYGYVSAVYLQIVWGRPGRVINVGPVPVPVPVPGLPSCNDSSRGSKTHCGHQVRLGFAGFESRR